MHYVLILLASMTNFNGYPVPDSPPVEACDGLTAEQCDKDCKMVTEDNDICLPLDVNLEALTHEIGHMFHDHAPKDCGDDSSCAAIWGGEW